MLALQSETITTTRSIRVRILLIDDHDLFREGLKYLLPVLEEGVQYFEARSIEAALEQDYPSEQDRPIDLVLLDLYMPGTQGMEALALCRQRFENASLVVVSGEEEPRIIREAIDKGAAGFIPKSSSRQVLEKALKVVLGGGTWLPEHALQPMARGNGDDDSSLQQLSRRQFEVLMKAVQGKSNKTIARELDISDHTVKAHLSVAYRVLGVHNRTEAVYAAAKLGFQPGLASILNYSNSMDEAHLQ